MVSPELQAKVEKAAINHTECVEQATPREWSSHGDHRKAGFIAGAEFLYSLMQSELEEAERRGIRKAIGALRSHAAMQFWRGCVGEKKVKGMIVTPNKNDWANWLESELLGERK